MNTPDSILELLNKAIREEHGRRLTLDSLLVDSEVDSFGVTMVILALDDNYKCFSSEWLKETPVEQLSVKQIVDRVLSYGSK